MLSKANEEIGKQKSYIVNLESELRMLQKQLSIAQKYPQDNIIVERRKSRA